MESVISKLCHLSYEMPSIRIALGVLYAFFFFLSIQMMIRRPVARNFLTGLLSFVFFLLALIFFSPFILSPGVYIFMQPWTGVFIAALPALLFFYFRRQFHGAEESIASMTRFNQLKDEFLSVASHELRTPLSVINGFAEILVREKLGPLNDEQKRRVRKILMQAQRLNHIVDELLDLSRIRSGKVQIRPEVFALVPVLKACLDDHLVVCEQQQIELVDEIPDVLPDVVGDIERITQIVVNLLNNAIKYTEPGGRVTLTVTHRKNKNDVYLEVKDTGIGIDPADQARVFDEFFRCNHPFARRFSGSGLGLAIVKQLVEVHGGTVGVHSEGLGKGSTFYFTLRLAAKTGKDSPEKEKAQDISAVHSDTHLLKKTA